MRERRHLFLRGFLLESIFNARGQQRGGLVWILRGALPETERRPPFNANPALAGYAVALANRSPDGEFPKHRGALTAALGALGDRILFAGLRPLAVAASVLAAAAGPIAAATALLLVYNPPELYLRWRSIHRGIQGMPAIMRDLSRQGLPRVTRPLARIAAVMAGCAAGFWSAGACASGRWIDVAAGVVIMPLGFLALRKRTGAIWAVPIAALLFSLAWFMMREAIAPLAGPALR